MSPRVRHTVNPKWIAQRIRTLLKVMKVNRARLSQALGVSSRTLGRWLAGEHAPELKTQELIGDLEQRWGIERKPFKG
jgi:transcriptional regulator with XRE-family HTH domain